MPVRLQRLVDADRGSHPVIGRSAKRARAYLLAAVSLCACDRAFEAGDGATGSMRISVVDRQGAPIEDAGVTVSTRSTNGSTSYTKPVDAQGRVTFTALRTDSRLEFVVTVGARDVSSIGAAARSP